MSLFDRIRIATKGVVFLFVSQLSSGLRVVLESTNFRSHYVIAGTTGTIDVRVHERWGGAPLEYDVVPGLDGHGISLKRVNTHSYLVHTTDRKVNTRPYELDVNSPHNVRIAKNLSTLVLIFFCNTVCCIRGWS